MYWGEQEGVSMYPQKELEIDETCGSAIGDSCVVKFGKKNYTGKIAFFGGLASRNPCIASAAYEIAIAIIQLPTLRIGQGTVCTEQ